MSPVPTTLKEEILAERKFGWFYKYPFEQPDTSTPAKVFNSVVSCSRLCFCHFFMYQNNFRQKSVFYVYQIKFLSKWIFIFDRFTFSSSEADDLLLKNSQARICSFFYFLLFSFYYKWRKENSTWIKNKWQWSKRGIREFSSIDKQGTETEINGAFSSLKKFLLVLSDFSSSDECDEE